MTARGVRRALRDNGLTLVFAVLFVAALAAQAVTGLALYNDQAIADGVDRIGLLQYVTSSDFAVDVAENWQSEYLQFLLYITLTAWFVQRGSPESKPVEDSAWNRTATRWSAGGPGPSPPAGPARPAPGSGCTPRRWAP